MRLRSILAILLSLTVLVCLGCYRPQGLEIHDDFKDYHSAFYNSARLNGKTLPIKSIVIRYAETGELPQNEMGRCSIGYGPKPLIRINASYWNAVSYWDRRELIFHELGHCVLGLSHNDTMIGWQPVSIMHTYHLGTSYYGPLTYSRYETQLFSMID